MIPMMEQLQEVQILLMQLKAGSLKVEDYPRFNQFIDTLDLTVRI
jgi:hypothetical protein